MIEKDNDKQVIHHTHQRSATYKTKRTQLGGKGGGGTDLTTDSLQQHCGKGSNSGQILTTESRATHTNVPIFSSPAGGGGPILIDVTKKVTKSNCDWPE